MKAHPFQAVGFNLTQPARPYVKEGQGTYKQFDWSYTGAWVADKIEGAGKFTYASGATYEGDWKVRL